MHDFNRLPNDIVRIVKIHESTLRKRLLEFGETPSSALTVDEFMAVDLEAEQDPPAFKAARKRDKERLQKLAESVGEFTVLQLEIDAALEKDLNKSKKRKTPGSPRNSGEEYDETAETENFIGESTISVITECLVENPSPAAMPSTSHSSQAELLAKSNIIPIIGIKPDLVAMCAVATEEPQIKKEGATEEVVFELDLEGLDDEEIDGYILTEKEAKFKVNYENTNLVVIFHVSKL